jgi:hypothetical protein
MGNIACLPERAQRKILGEHVARIHCDNGDAPVGDELDRFQHARIPSPILVKAFKSPAKDKTPST